MSMKNVSGLHYFGLGNDQELHKRVSSTVANVAKPGDREGHTMICSGRGKFFELRQRINPDSTPIFGLSPKTRWFGDSPVHRETSDASLVKSRGVRPIFRYAAALAGSRPSGEMVFDGERDQLIYLTNRKGNI